jgi:protoporphyrinogen oxidase
VELFRQEIFLCYFKKKTDMKKNIIIIGAGPAGLTAGYELSKHPDFAVTILEEDVQAGGISKTVNCRGNRMDIGGHRFFSKNDAVMKWWTDIMPVQSAPGIDDMLLARKKDYARQGADPEKTDRVMLIRQRFSRIFYLRKFFDYPISPKIETFVNMGLFRTLKAVAGYIGASVWRKRETSLENFYINRFGKPLYKMFFENYTEKVWGVHPSQLGADWGAQRVKGLSVAGIVWNMISKPFRRRDISQKGTETSLIENFIYPKYGPGQLWETVADDIQRRRPETNILYAHRVTNIHVENNRVRSVTALHNETEITLECECLLSSMPVRDLVAALHGIDVPPDVRETAEKLPYRDFITVGLLVNRLRIKNKTKIKTVGNIIPDTWIYIQDPDVRMGRLQIFNNWSPYMVKDFERKIWLGLEYFCNEGDDLWNMSEEDFVDFATGELVRTGMIDRADVEDGVRIKVKKAYPSYHGSYRDLPGVVAFLDTIPNLYCIGRNGQHRYNNMDHSMLTAMEAVRNITEGRATKNNIWSVNTEKDYHEEKKQ